MVNRLRPSIFHKLLLLTITINMVIIYLKKWLTIYFLAAQKKIHQHGSAWLSMFQDDPFFGELSVFETLLFASRLAGQSYASALKEVPWRQGPGLRNGGWLDTRGLVVAGGGHQWFISGY